MFPKPVKEEKQRMPHNSLHGGKKKVKKPVSELKQIALANHKERPSAADRGEFPRKVIEELIADAGGVCQSCKSAPDTTTHHVQPKGRRTSPGRGVKTNGLRLCWPCHDRIQTNEDELQYWIEIYRQRYGENFWFDAEDWEEFERKKTAERIEDQEKQMRSERLAPVLSLLTAAAGRPLRKKEMRLIEAMDERQLEILIGLIGDMAKTLLPGQSFGYGHFED